MIYWWRVRDSDPRRHDFPRIWPRTRGARRHWSAPWNGFASPYVPTFNKPPLALFPVPPSFLEFSSLRANDLQRHGYVDAIVAGSIAAEAQSSDSRGPEGTTIRAVVHAQATQRPP